MLKITAIQVMLTGAEELLRPECFEVCFFGQACCMSAILPIEMY